LRLYRRGQHWWADFWHKGRRVRRSSGTESEAAAREWADTLKASLWRESKLGERPRVSWDSAVLDWLDEKKDKASLEDDKDRLRWLSKHLKGVALDEITHSALTKLARRLTKDGNANGTVNRYMAAASGVLHHARAQEWLAAVPKIPHLEEPKYRIRFLQDEQEADKLIAELAPNVAQMSRFALATGMRRHNVTHLEWSQVDLKRRGAWYHAEEMKAGKPLWCHFNADAIAVLREQKVALERRQREGKLLPGEARWVFPYRGGPVHDVTTRAWHEACGRAEIHDFTFHDWRHTWASWHVQRGTPLDVLKELGGWSTLEMVQKYAHLAPSHVAKWADNVARKRSQSKKRPTKKTA
jgi:integrase